MRDIYVYGSIGDNYWSEGGVSAARFVDMLRDADGDDVCIHINSCGGNVFDAHAMSESIRQYSGRVTASIEGLAASSASFFALTADEVVMNASALMMVHNPWGYQQGTAEEMRACADSLDKVRTTIVRAYASKTGAPEDDISTLMDDETWMDAYEALDRGFVDRLSDDAPSNALMDEKIMAMYRNVPVSLSAGVDKSGRPVLSNDATGHGGENIGADEARGAAGSAARGAGAARATVCVNGTFLRA